MEGFKKFFDGPFFIYGHNQVANLIGSSVKGDGEADGDWEFGEFSDARC